MRFLSVRLPVPGSAAAVTALTAVIAVIAAVLAPAPAAHAQNLVQNPGFEGAFNAGNFENWTSTPASSGSNIFRSGFSHTGSYAAGFAAINGIDDALSQTITTVANQQYTFSFWLYNDGTGGDHFAAYWDNQVIPVFEIGPNGSSFDYTRYVFPVIASGTSTQIRFAGNDRPAAFRLDDVSVTANDPTPPTAVTPEASSVVNLCGALLGPGVLGMVAVRKRQRRRRGAKAA